MAKKTLLFRNNTPVFGWSFMALWTGMLGLFTWLFIREGGFHQFHPLVEFGIMALFWLFGLAGCSYFFSMPRVRLTIAGNEVIVSERWMWRSRVERFPLRDLAEPTFSEEKDSEGDPYFFCRLTTPSGRTVTFSEHHHRPIVEAERDRLLAAMV